ncbi:MAG: translation initiation factor 2, partial [Rhodobacterales bacterium]|nr:translation initiation factor 2 [Rhodobacterales bacterium]
EPAPPPVDPALAGARPRARPEGLVPPSPADPGDDDDAALTPGVDTRLAAIRPQPRPTAALAASKAALADRQSELAAAAAAASLAAAPPVAAGSDLAVAVSRRPAARPADFNRAIEAAVAAAAAPPASAAPSIPTRASVAKQATFASAINLSRLNLIGVYGTASNRSALIRQPSGRYQKVEVGDRLDGGTVKAIGENSLTYVKGGRSVTLQLPRT